MLAVGVVQIIIVEVTGLEQSGQKPDQTYFLLPKNAVKSRVQINLAPTGFYPHF